MVSTTAAGLPSGAAVATAKKAAAAKAAAAKKPRAKPSHPPTGEMVQAAIKALKERGGSSLQAIKKYIAATYKIDAEKLAPFIKKNLKSGVVAKKLVQTKGKGAAGSFKLNVGAADKKAAGSAKRAASPAKKKKPATAAVKKSPAKKPAAKKPKKKVLKTVAAKPPKPKTSGKPKAAKKPKPAKKAAVKAKKTGVKKAPAKK